MVALRTFPRRVLGRLLRAVRPPTNPVAAPERDPFIDLAFQNCQNEISLAELTKASSPCFKQLAHRTDLKVHLGCGPYLKTGWVNIDMSSAPPEPVTEGTIFIGHDLRRGLPLAENSCTLIYSCHFFEHLEYCHAIRLMNDCFTALQPGGLFRIALPNLERCFSAYLKRDHEYLDLVPIDRAAEDYALVDIVNRGVYCDGQHKYVWDEEKVIRVLKKIGFRDVSPSDFRAEIDPDAPIRKRYTFYVEAHK
jgi:predicted SAM-dependent methyltransferase